MKNHTQLTILKKIFRKIISRRAPHTLFNYRFFLPNQKKIVKLHRKVFFNAFKDYPRIVWACVFLYSSITWLCWYSWKAVFRMYVKNASYCRDEFGVPKYVQIRGLISTAICYFIPPVDYYRYSLFSKNKDEWFDFIYVHELPHWHHIHGIRKQGKKLARLMSDKHGFSDTLAEKGLPTVKSLAFLKKGDNSFAELFRREKGLGYYFFKPNIGNRGRGIFSLTPDKSTNGFILKSEKDTVELEPDNVVRYIEERIKDEDYLIQPVLKNHPKLKALVDTETLAVFRMLTGLIEGAPCLVSGLLVIPFEKGFISFMIDTDTGVLLKNTGFYQSKYKENVSDFQEMVCGQVVPFWNELMKTAEKAHAHFPDMKTIMWDMALADEGVVIIEGNSCWGLEVRQSLRGEPLLETPLLDVYDL